MNPSTVLRGLLSIPMLLEKINRLDERTSPKDLVDIAMDSPAIRPQQVTSEFLELANTVKDQQCKCILEIGTYRGGTLFVFSQVAAENATVISVDMSMTVLGNLYRVCQKPLLSRLVRKGQSLLLLRKDSHRDDTLESIKRALHGQTLDFLFIDGDHSYEGVRKDFEMYSPLVRSGGLLAFHDIRISEDLGVCRLWNEIKKQYIYKEFVDRTGNAPLGIGVLWL